MDTIRNNFAAGRTEMIEAFAELTALARRAGVDPDQITAIHGRFFDGNVAIKQAFRAAIILR